LLTAVTCRAFASNTVSIAIRKSTRISVKNKAAKNLLSSFAPCALFCAGG
jgi:hypothetical protein